MAHTWKYAFSLGLVGAAFALSCTVTEGDGDIDKAGAAGEGASGGTGGTGVPVAECDPLEDSTDYPDCEPVQGDEECGGCVKQNCCEESMKCYGTEPYNVCGWGGPTDGDYSGAGEIGCYRTCLEEYVSMNDDTCDSDGIEYCTGFCLTTECTLIGDATNELAGCMLEFCPAECFGAETCDA